MIRITLEQLARRAINRPQDYIKDVMDHGRMDGDAVLLSDEEHERLKRKYKTPIDDFLPGCGFC